MKVSAWVASAALAMASAGCAHAVEVRGDVGMNIGYLIAGSSAVKGRPANPTGGATAMPFGRVAVALPHLAWLDASFALSPFLVTPFSLEQIGLVAAHDVGVSFHPANRSFAVGVAGTVAPSYMRFCNVQWCLREPLVIGGGEVHVLGNVFQYADGRGLHIDLQGRLLYARPTAWTWPGLSPADRQIIPTMGIITGGALWTW